VELYDIDLISVQEARNLIALAVKAQALYKESDQSVVDKLVAAVSKATQAQAAPLAVMAHEETGFGKWEDKVVKNLFASQNVYNYIKDLKTIGVINEDKEKKIVEIGVPVGVIAGLIPSTNPTSTTIFKSLIALKAGCAIIFSPHPSAKKSITTTVEIIRSTLVKEGFSPDLVSVLATPTKEATDTLMKHKDVSLILATGGNAMVKAAYSSGTPALGVGPGNGPSYIEKSANIPLAVKRIFDSKTFDNGTICASEQSIVTENCIRKEVMEEVQKQGGYFLPPGDSEKLEKILMNSSGTMNAKLVGRSAQYIAKAAGISIPSGARVLLGEETRVGPKFPYSKEKLMPVLGFYVEENWEKACIRCIEILNAEGAGHTMSIHSQDENVIREFGLKKPVSRLIVNSPAALSGIGATTSLVPSLTLGCGAVGGNASSDNISPLNLIDIRRIAYGVREIEDIRPSNIEANSKPSCANLNISKEEIDLLVEKIVSRLKNNL